MRDWQDEIELLLERLGVSLVTLDIPAEPYDELLTDGYDAELAHRALTAPLCESAGVIVDRVLPQAGEEVLAVRREIEATLAQIDALVRSGQVDRTLREDVALVLRALIRVPGATARESADPAGAGGEHGETEWELDSVAAVLRLCRIVTRLTRTYPRIAQS